MTILAGLYRATVMHNIDPMMRKRLMISAPDIIGAIELWAEPCMPYRSRAIPPVGSTVWIQFEGGNPDFPVWLGVRP